MQPLTLRIQIIEYRKESNDFIANTKTGESFVFDPFIACSLSMTNEECEAGKGFEFIGREFLISKYTVTNNFVYSKAGGIIEITCNDSLENIK